jgi:two-component system chemotaxis response regulator CheY
MKRVLIVDDALVMRLMLKDLLEKNGYEVVGEAKNGFECIELFKELNPDLVTLDIAMPECDGLQALKELKKINPEAKVVMISALGQKIQVLEAIKNGASDFIVKPFDDENVIKTISNVF